jgi:hypothetical protein
VADVIAEHGCALNMYSYYWDYVTATPESDLGEVKGKNK